ncbi:hypothetical protein C2G38_2121164 [Gigaspora rosea]|uniref:Uncharacterized protein n=1 Tax=Gigaspora rosea TaxID=44941 RepID=A0A397U512_9GLOM|nr:hypothetical protein C2G38_2121164 [Gigaspora rosea]
MNDILAFFSIYVSFSSGLLSFLFTVTTSLTGIIVGNLSLLVLQRTSSDAFIQASYRERISILLLGQQIKSSLWQGLSFELFYNFSMWFRHYEKLWPVIIMCFVGNILVSLTELTSESVLFPENSYYTTQNKATLLFDPVTGLMDTTLKERGNGFYSNQDYANFYKFLQSNKSYIKDTRLYTDNKVCIAPNNISNFDGQDYLNNTSFNTICQWVNTQCATYDVSSMSKKSDQIEYRRNGTAIVLNSRWPNVNYTEWADLYDFPISSGKYRYNFTIVLTNPNITFVDSNTTWKNIIRNDSMELYETTIPGIYLDAGLDYLGVDNQSMITWSGSCDTTFAQCRAYFSNGIMQTCYNITYHGISGNSELPYSSLMFKDLAILNLAMQSQSDTIKNHYSDAISYALSKSLVAWYNVGNFPNKNSSNETINLMLTKYVIKQHFSYLPLLFYPLWLLFIILYCLIRYEKPKLSSYIYTPISFINLFGDLDDVTIIEQQGDSVKLSEVKYENRGNNGILEN